MRKDNFISLGSDWTKIKNGVEFHRLAKILVKVGREKNIIISSSEKNSRKNMQEDNNNTFK